MTHKPTVLFVCVHNAGRPQMAEEGLDAVRPIRDDIKARIERLLAEILPR